ncbi:MAG: tetratricopeptide repeat protein [Planctomycetota bacterium]
MVAAGVGALTFAAFAPALNAGLVNFDDTRLLVDNASYRGLGGDHIRWMFSTKLMGHYQPLTWISYAVDYRLAGSKLDPAQFHLTNLLLHAGNAVLFFFVAMRLLAAALPITNRKSLILASALAAALFSIHPLRVESVAWATERRDVLSVFFMLAALLAYLRSVGPGAGLKSPTAYGFSILLLACSLLSKAWGMTFFALLIILDFYPLRRLPARSNNDGGHGSGEHPDNLNLVILLQKVPFVIMAIPTAYMAMAAQSSALTTMKSLDDWGMVERFVQSVYGLGFYLLATFWPVNLIPLYELPLKLNPWEPKFVAAYVAVALIILALLRFRKHRALIACAAFYVMTLAPVLGIFQSGPQLVADRYSYVSCMGIPLLIAGGFLLLRQRNTGFNVRAWGVAVALVLAALFVATWRQTGVWKDSRTLWHHTILTGIPCATAHLNYGITFDETSDVAIDSYRQALAIDPAMGNAWYALGNALRKRERYGEAEEAFLEATRHMVESHLAYFNLGNLYHLRMGRTADGIQAYQSAIDQIEASNGKMFSPKPYLNLGITLKSRGLNDEARKLLEVAARHKSTRNAAIQHLQSITD